MVPFSIFYVAIKRLIIKGSEFDNKWEDVYENVQKKSAIKRLYRLWFCLRRVIFTVSVFKFKDNQNL